MEVCGVASKDQDRIARFRIQMEVCGVASKDQDRIARFRLFMASQENADDVCNERNNARMGPILQQADNALSTLSLIPLEVRLKIYSFCDHNDLKILSLCSKRHYQDVVSILWRRIKVTETHWDQDELLSKQILKNLAHTQHIEFAGGRGTLRHIEQFTSLISNCHPDQLRRVVFDNCIARNGLEILAQHIPSLASLEVSGMRNSNHYPQFFKLQSVERFRFLQELKCWDCCMTDDILINNVDLTHLESLTVGECSDVTARSLYHFSAANAPKLKYYYFGQYYGAVFCAQKFAKELETIGCGLARLEVNGIVVKGDDVDTDFHEALKRSGTYCCSSHPKTCPSYGWYSLRSTGGPA